MRIERLTNELGEIQFLSEGNLINILGKDDKSKFWIKPDGSCSVGAGANGMNFFTLNNVPNKPINNKLLGVKNDKIDYFDSVDLTDITAKKIEVDNGKFKSLSVNDINTNKFSSPEIICEKINVENKLNVDEIEVENIDGKQGDLLALKVVDINCLDTLLVENIDINGSINRNQKQYGSLDNPISISKADTNSFNMEDANRLVIFGRHYNRVLAFNVKSNKKDLWTNKIVKCEINDLDGEGVFIVEKLIKKVNDNEFKVEVVFNKSIAGKSKIEKIVIDLD
tara:strand:+ start:6221 stop:7063 length:843 start_codon:yes stop_codon:yes gene_type:complete